jgi:hypothetical protein
MKKKLIHILMLAAVLGLMSPAAAKASTITLNYAVGTNQSDTAKFDLSAAGYQFVLSFDNVIVAFTVDVTATIAPNVTLPPGYACVPINGGTNCVLFTATPNGVEGVNWTGGFDVFIAWNTDTNALYPNTPVGQNGIGQIRMLHFDTFGVHDITQPNSYCTTCGVDPGIGGQADNFSSFMVATTAPAAVPEPGTLALLGSGVVALVAGLRRRRQK